MPAVRAVQGDCERVYGSIHLDRKPSQTTTTHRFPLGNVLSPWQHSSRRTSRFQFVPIDDSLAPGGRFQHKDVLLPVQKFPLWKYNNTWMTCLRNRTSFTRQHLYIVTTKGSDLRSWLDAKDYCGKKMVSLWQKCHSLTLCFLSYFQEICMYHQMG